MELEKKINHRSNSLRLDLTNQVTIYIHKHVCFTVKNGRSIIIDFSYLYSLIQECRSYRYRYHHRFHRFSISLNSRERVIRAKYVVDFVFSNVYVCSSPFSSLDHRTNRNKNHISLVIFASVNTAS